MICPYCGNNEWAYSIIIINAGEKALCTKCAYSAQLTAFQEIDRIPKGIYDRRDNQNNPSNNSSSSSMVGVHSHIQAVTEDTRISSLPSWLL